MMCPSEKQKSGKQPPKKNTNESVLSQTAVSCCSLLSHIPRRVEQHEARRNTASSRCRMSKQQRHATNTHEVNGNLHSHQQLGGTSKATEPSATSASTTNKNKHLTTARHPQGQPTTTNNNNEATKQRNHNQNNQQQSNKSNNTATKQRHSNTATTQ